MAASINYKQILKHSWELTKKHKWLWVYGLVLAAFSGGGFSGGGGGGSGSSSKKTPSIPSNLPKDLPGKASKVLGDATTIFKDWIAHVPIHTWLLLGLGILLLIVVGIAISLVIQSWAKGGLIAGLDDADNDKTPTLASTTQRGISSIKYLILYGIISFFVGFGLILGFLLAAGLLIGGIYVFFQFSSVLQTIWLIVGVITGLLTLLFLVILLAMVGIYAERLIVLKGATPWDAWKEGFRTARTTFFPTIAMGTLNSLVGCSAGCLSLLVLLLILGIPAILIVVSLFKDGNFHWPSSPQSIALIILFFLFVYLNLLVRALLVVFSYGTWNLFFKEITKGEKV